MVYLNKYSCSIVLHVELMEEEHPQLDNHNFGFDLRSYLVYQT